MNRIAALSAIAIATLSMASYAGPITPPLGPVASTAKPLADIEPRTAINAANTPGDADSIFVINQSGSYYLTANFSAQSGKNAIKINNLGATNVSIDLAGFTIKGVPGSLVGIKTTNSVGGTTLHIRNGAIVSMGGNGIDINAQAVSLSDISVEFCSTGFLVNGSDATVTNCRAFWNAADGFNIPASGVISGCAADTNTGSGFVLGGTQRLERSLVNNSGVKAISAGYGSFIADCRISGGSSELVSLTGGCTVEHCSITGGGGIAIHATNSANVIQDNALSAFGGTGIQCDGIGHFVVRNTSRGFATPYVIPPGSFAGPIVNTAAGMATAGPWANFAY